jgi:CheY-like chemotaxis protein
MKKLLVLDDQESITGLVKMLFQHLGYEVILR